GKKDANDLDRELALRAAESRRNGVDEERRRQYADEHGDRDDHREKRGNGAGDPIGFLPLAARDEARIHRNQRRRQRPFAEQILEEVGNSERRVERVGGVGLEAEVMREGSHPNEAGQTAHEDAGGDENGRPAHARGRIPRLSVSHAYSTSSSATVSPSVPLAFFIRYDLMKPSRSPSSTRLMSPTCSLVRWSFTN